MKPDVICHETMLLGESPLWHPVEKSLYWVDIVDASLYRLNINEGSMQTFKMPAEITAIGWRKKGGLIATLRDRFVTIDTKTGATQTVTLPPQWQQNEVMFNDGKCDRQGRFWVGTKDVVEERSIASLYCLDSKGEAKEIIKDNFTVSNGIAWNLKNNLMYICDTPARLIYQYEFDPLKGSLGRVCVFARVSEGEGFPDGLTVDSEGYLWSCHWDGWQITRYKPTGEIDGIIPMPVPRPTSCCFGGPELKTLYITSASVRLSPTELEDAPQSGQVFAMKVGIEGLEEPPYLG